MDGPLRELERKALLGDPEAQRLYLATLRRSVAPLTSDELQKLQKLIGEDLDSRSFIISEHLSEPETFDSCEHYIDKGKTLQEYLREQVDNDTTYYFYKQHLDRSFELVDGQSIPEPGFRYIARTALISENIPVPVRTGDLCICPISLLLFSGCQCEGD